MSRFRAIAPGGDKHRKEAYSKASAILAAHSEADARRLLAEAKVGWRAAER
jgi:hypothetical protein